MWLYMNPNGTISTCIEHGEPVRQGNDVNFYICFPNEEKYENLTVSLKALNTSTNTYSYAAHNISDSVFDVIIFNKAYLNEVSYDFKDGTQYIRYSLTLDSAATSKYGVLPIQIDVSDGSNVTSYSANINVQKVYGNSTRTSITDSEYNNLLNAINDGITKRGKLDGDNEWSGKNSFSVLPTYSSDYEYSDFSDDSFVTKEYMEKNSIKVVTGTITLKDATVTIDGKTTNVTKLNELADLLAHTTDISIPNENLSISWDKENPVFSNHLHLVLTDGNNKDDEYHFLCEETSSASSIVYACIKSYYCYKLAATISSNGEVKDWTLSCYQLASYNDIIYVVDNYGKLSANNTWTGQNTFNESIIVKSGNVIKANEIDNYNGNALVRFKFDEGKNVFGGVNYDTVIMGKSDRPYYSKSGSNFSGSELALKSDSDSKLDKHTEATDIHQAYVKSSSGENWMWDMSEYNKANTIAFRTSDGQLKVNETPTEDDDATSKKYVDDKADSKLDKNTTSQYIVYGTTTAGTQASIPYAPGATANTIPIRNSSGQAQIKPYKAGPTIYTDTTTDNYIANLGQLTKMHKYDYGNECWSNTLIIGDIASPKAISLPFIINGNGDQCPIWMFQLNNSTDTTTLNWSDLDQTTLLPLSNTIYWLGGIEPIFEYGKRYTLMFWPADSSKVGAVAGSEYTGALIGTWSAA
jgi:hypothetical protein